jgi:N-acetylglutamate synthase-like GNAT family acetyltransferase
MITTRNAVKRDVANLVAMVKDFTDTYDGVMVHPTSFKQAIINDLVQYRVIEMAGKITGFYTYITIGNKFESWNTIKDMYVKPEFRGQGIASQARVQAVKKDRVVGLSITYNRARKNADYFVAQGFDHVGFDPLEQGAQDHNLCILLRGTNDNYPVVHPLNVFSINKLQKDAMDYWTSYAKAA